MKKEIIKQVLDPFFISLFVVVALALSIFYLVYYPKKLNENIKPCLDGQIDQITKIKIDQTVLEKQDQGWVIASNNNLPADKNKVNQLLDVLKQIKKDNIVSKNKQYHEKYGVTEESGTKVTVLHDQKQMLQVLIGNAGPGFSGTYFRLPEDDAVYLSKVGLRSAIIQNYWKDLTITNFYSDEVTKIEVGNQTFEDVENEKVKTLIGRLTGLTADDIIKVEEELKQTNPSKIKIYLKDKEISLVIFANEGNFYAIKPEQENLIYQLDPTKAKNINQAIVNLLSS